MPLSAKFPKWFNIAGGAWDSLKDSCWIWIIIIFSFLLGPSRVLPSCCGIRNTTYNTLSAYCSRISKISNVCSKPTLIGETQFHCEFVHSRDTNRWPPRWEANGWPTGPVRLCSGVKLQGLRRAPPPQQLDQGSNPSLCCKEEEDLQGVEWNQGRQYVIKLAFYIIGTKPSKASHCRRRA